MHFFNIGPQSVLIGPPYHLKNFLGMFGGERTFLHILCLFYSWYFINGLRCYYRSNQANCWISHRDNHCVRLVYGKIPWWLSKWCVVRWMLILFARASDPDRRVFISAQRKCFSYHRHGGLAGYIQVQLHADRCLLHNEILLSPLKFSLS
jgi:hypothetical protein